MKRNKTICLIILVMMVVMFIFGVSLEMALKMAREAA